MARDGAGGEVLLVDGQAKGGNLAFDGTGLTFGTPPVTLDLTGGSIYGAIETRNTTLANLRTNLDALAAQLVNEVNLAYNPTGITGDFFDPAGITAATIQLDSALTVTTLKTSDSAEVAANELALAVAGIADQRFSTISGDLINGSFREFIADVTAQVGEALSSVEQKLENQQLVESIIKEQRNSLGGISTDEEVADMIRFQRAFQATARVINIIDDMLEIIVTGLSR